MEEEEMTYAVIRLEDKVVVYLAPLSYKVLHEQLDKIIAFFKTSVRYEEFYLLEIETGKLIKLCLLEKKKVDLATKIL